MIMELLHHCSVCYVLQYDCAPWTLSRLVSAIDSQPASQTASQIFTAVSQIKFICPIPAPPTTGLLFYGTFNVPVF
jgi:hypothetical protein